jgi:hypothetical protein
VGSAQPGIGVCDAFDEAVRQATLVPTGAVGNVHADEVVVVWMKLSVTIGTSAANAVVARAIAATAAMPPAAKTRRSLPFEVKMGTRGAFADTSSRIYSGTLGSARRERLLHHGRT